MTGQGCSRRAVLGAGLAGAGAVGLAACGATPGGGRRAGNAAGSSTAQIADGITIGAVADVPVGGSAASRATVGGDPVVVSRKDAATVAAFSAVCTHMGCTVNPGGSLFHCPCHGSVYDAFTGQVVSGPAPRPLTPVPVDVRDGEIVTRSSAG
jgi:Rieske Fe-S protein